MFEVFHKKEIIYINKNFGEKKELDNNKSIQFKCFYCGNKSNTLNRFKAHMRIHVCKILLYNSFLLLKKYRLDKSLLNAYIVIKLLPKK